MLRKDKREWMYEEFGFPKDFKSKVIDKGKRLIEPKDFIPNDEKLISCTNQILSTHSNLEMFAEFVEHMNYKTGLPPTIFVDECHTGSEPNTWGNDVYRLVNAGARAVLLTATPWRGDKKKIKGFTYIDEKIGDSTRVIRSGIDPADEEYVLWDRYFSKDFQTMIQPDHETTFAEAWAEDVLCKLSIEPLDIDLKRIKGLDEKEYDERLSELSPTEAKKILGRLVKDPIFMQEALENFYEKLKNRKKIMLNSAGIVFCGSDELRKDSERNKHPNQIKKILHNIDPSLKILIVTVANEGCSKDLERFEKSDDDVLIVKSMAGMGYDCPRAKIGLDLSPVRTLPSNVQRMTRIATPYEGIKQAIWICPADIITTKHVEVMIKNQGGEAKFSELEYLETYRKKKEEIISDSFIIQKVFPTDFSDTAQNIAQADLYHAANEMRNKLYEYFKNFSLAEVALIMETIKENKFKDGEKVINTTEEAIRRRNVNNSVKDEIMSLMLKSRKEKGESYSDSWYRDQVKQIWNAAKRLANIPLHLTHDEIENLDDLSNLNLALERIRSKIKGDDET
jgi:hypothetical protein